MFFVKSRVAVEKKWTIRRRDRIRQRFPEPNSVVAIATDDAPHLASCERVQMERRRRAEAAGRTWLWKAAECSGNSPSEIITNAKLKIVISN